jgi:hypothetical protein
MRYIGIRDLQKLSGERRLPGPTAVMSRLPAAFVQIAANCNSDPEHFPHAGVSMQELRVGAAAGNVRSTRQRALPEKTAGLPRRYISPTEQSGREPR